jgi:hypothetical protein
MKSFVFFFLLCGIGLVSCSKKQTKLIEINFDTLPQDLSSADIFFNTFCDYSTFHGYGAYDGRLSLEKRADGNALTTSYDPAFSGPMGGVAWITMFGSQSQTRLSYKLKFAENFNFYKGGKLPGLAGGEKVEPGKCISGKKGWCCRLTFEHDSSLRMLVYFLNSGSQYNIVRELKHAGSSCKVKPGSWYSISMVVSVNDPGKSNGSIECSIDGKSCLSVHDINFRDTTKESINHLQFSAFFGEGETFYAPDNKQVISFDDVVVE